ESLRAVDTPFGEPLIVFHGTARVGMAFESQARIRLALEIGLEITGERSESSLLAGKQASVAILERGLGCRKINTVQGKSPLDGADIWRLRWGLNVHRGCGRSHERLISVIAHIAGHGNCPRLRAPGVQGSGGGVAGNVSGARCVTVGQPAAIGAAGVRVDG